MTTNNAPTAAEALEIRKQLPAPPGAVFRALTEPARMQQWFSPSDDVQIPLAEADLRIGGKWRIGMRMPDDRSIKYVGGRYTTIDPPNRLAFTWQWEHEDESHVGESLVTIELVEANGGTKLHLTHERLSDESSRAGHEQGWTGSLTRLEKYLGK